jgi:glycosyltransferase involved in cell wall biosynthesis
MGVSELRDSVGTEQLDASRPKSSRLVGPMHGGGARVVLYTSSECWRGAGISFVNIARGLERNGFQPHVVSLCQEVSEEFVQAGVPVTQLPRREGEAWRLRKFLARFGAEVLLVDRAHDIRVGTLAVLGTRTALVSRYNHFRAKPPEDLLIRVAYGVALRELVFLTGSARRRVLAEVPFMRRVRPVTIYEGIDVNRFHPSDCSAATFRRSHDLGCGPFVLAVGALSGEKRYEFLFDALSRLGDDAPLLVVCGEGEEEKRLRQKAEALSVRVRFTGRLPQSELVGAYNAAIGLVHVGDVETFGLSVLEAMACARPVIASAGGALPEVIGTDGSCGQLVPVNSRAAVSAAIQSLVANPDGAAEWGLRARARAKRYFSLEAMEDGYAELAARHARTCRIGDNVARTWT